MSPDLLGSRRAVSGADGVFQLLALPPGTYTLRVAAIGFGPVVMHDVHVQLGRTTAVGEVTLVATATVLSEVKIAAPRITLDPARTTIGATFEAADLAALPAERDYKSLGNTLPHVNTSYHGDAVNSGGSTGLENMYFIDGVNVTTPLSASTGTSLPYNFIRSVEVRSGGYEAQYGRALGAIVNAVTYTGTNTFETSTFGFFTHDALAAKPKSQPTLKELGSFSYDVGARVSGPVVRDRLWFSAAYNPRVDHATKVIAGAGSFVDEQRANIFAGKLTWNAAPGTTVQLSVFGDPTRHEQVTDIPWISTYAPLTADPFLRLRESGGTTASLRASGGVGASFQYVAEIARSTSKDNDKPRDAAAPADVLFIDNIAQTVGGKAGVTVVAQGRTSGVLRGTLTTGRHTIVGGIEYEDARVSRRFGGVGILRNDVSVFVVDSNLTDGTFHGQVPTAYLQDAWRPAERLTINAGLRWSSQRLTGASGGTAQRFPAEWQPRAGFSWQIGATAAQRVFGSYGRFYQQEPLNLPTLFYADYFEPQWYYAVDPRQPGARPDSMVSLTTSGADFSQSVPNVEAEHFDEYTLGYERLLLGDARLTLRGVRRMLASAFLFSIDPSRQPPFVIGTPGEGDLDYLPAPTRTYTAVEASLEGTWRRLQYRSSYVWSRTFGNYTGLFTSDAGFASPGFNAGLFMAHQARNSTGLLPNDRTHVIKLASTVAATSSLKAGAFLTVQSGTPLNEFGAWAGGSGPPAFLVARGSNGRTPAIWDVSLRLSYAAARFRGTSRVVLDILHAGNPQTGVRIDQQHYLNVDDMGNQGLVNPSYLRQTAFQPPMTVRLGIEVGR